MPAEPISILKSINSGKVYPLNEVRFTSDNGELLDVIHDFERIKKQHKISKEYFFKKRVIINDQPSGGVWHFKELILPEIHDDHIISKQEGNTRLYRSKKVSSWLALKQDKFYLKHEGENPTGSFKDRGMTVAITMAKQLKQKAVTCASTGNTSASLAAYASEAELTGLVLIPKGNVAVGKISQALAYGTKTLVVNGDFDDCMRLIREAQEKLSAYPLNSINPFRLEGQKTIIWETLMQLNWNVPDWFVFPGGNLGNTSAFGKAVFEAYELGLIDRMPRFAVIQAEGASPFYKAYKNNFTGLKTEKAETIATAIKIGDPVNYTKAVRSLKWTNGIVESVTDEEILEAKAHVDSAGIGAEPASCATVAGIKKLIAAGEIKPKETVVGILTGNILKDPQVIVDYHLKKKSPLANPPYDIEAAIGEMKKFL
ncbi:MAG: threonine synthase [Ignavibacteriales bacterium]|nr:threonine synthase [Ignavibacteriales bacterium]